VDGNIAKVIILSTVKSALTGLNFFLFVIDAVKFERKVV
jgi:hypothetical protein